MRFTATQVALLGAVGIANAYPREPRSYRTPKPDLAKANAVKAAFRTAWNGYYKYAFPNDELMPVTNTYNNDRNGWAATAIDALDTAIIMGDEDIVTIILKEVPKIDFTTTAVVNQTVSVFESTIRYIGGMLASYDLLNGPCKGLIKDQSLIEPLLKQAKTLADSLSVAFGTPSGVPDGEIILNPTHRRNGDTTNNVAEAGSLILEWTRLADLTGNTTYSKLVEKDMSYLLHPTGDLDTWPGLVGENVNLTNGEFTDSDGGWSGGMDSFYEYLIKMYLYDAQDFTYNKDRWVLAVDSTIKHLASHPSTNESLTFLAQYNEKMAITTTGHLASFAGGNFILGGILLNNQEFKDFGLAVTESYYHTYVASAAGIGPEQFNWVDKSLPANSNNQPPPANQTAMYDKDGFYDTNPQYLLRPETVESIWYAYRLTGDPKWQAASWEAFSQVTKVCRVGSGYSDINNVNDANGGGFLNVQETFFLAEFLKYTYLTFAPDAPYQLQAHGPNEFVFNTEAHPLKVRNYK